LGLVIWIGMGLSNTILDFGKFISTCIAARKLLADAPHRAVALESLLAIRNFSVPEKFGRPKNIQCFLYLGYLSLFISIECHGVNNKLMSIPQLCAGKRRFVDGFSYLPLKCSKYRVVNRKWGGS